MPDRPDGADEESAASGRLAAVEAAVDDQRARLDEQRADLQALRSAVETLNAELVALRAELDDRNDAEWGDDRRPDPASRGSAEPDDRAMESDDRANDGGADGKEVNEEGVDADRRADAEADPERGGDDRR